MKRRILLVFGVLLALSSCMDDSDDYPTVEETIERDDKTIQDFFTTNNIENAIADESGVYIDIIEEGEGESPEEGGVVRVYYKYYSLPSNKLVAEVEDLTKWELEKTLQGLNIGIPYMKEGGVADIYIPCRYAFYGSTSPQANSVLRFRVTLNDYAETIEEMDDKIIQEYFVANEITNAIKDVESGVYIQHIAEGSGEDFPETDSNITVKYELYTIPNDEEIEKTDEAVTFNLGGLIKGWQVGIPLMKKGGEAYLYIPSSQAYRGTSNKIANEVLKFKIDLLDF